MDNSTSKYPQIPSDYTLRLNDMLNEADVLKYIGGWWAFLSALLAIFFNGLVLRLVFKRLKQQYNIDMMLVSIVLSIDLIYCIVVILNQLLMVGTGFQILFANAYVQVTGFLIPFLILMSLYMVAVLSFERYMFTVKGIKWTPWSYYALAVGYVSPPLILGLVAASTSQFMPMPSCIYSLILIDQSSYGAIYIGFFTVQSIAAGLVFNSSYLSILLHHRKLLMNPGGEHTNKPKVKPPLSHNNENLSLQAMLEQPVPTTFKLREKEKSKALANTLLYKTLTIMLIYNLICIPQILALAYELISLTPRSPLWDFIVVITVSNHALVSPLVVLFLHQPTNDDWQVYKLEIKNYISNTLFSRNGGSRNINNSVVNKDLTQYNEFVATQSNDPILDKEAIQLNSKYSKDEEIVTYQS